MATTNVSFLRGLHANLPAAGSAKDGAFYLTTDSNRLYVGNAQGNLVDLNKYIKTVASVSDLDVTTAQVGDFYYVKDKNLLVVCEMEGSSKKWTLINQNTDTTNKSLAITPTSTGSATTFTPSVKVQVTDSGNNSVQDTKPLFTMTAGNNVQFVKGEGNALTINGAEYTLGIESNPAAAGNLQTLTLKLTNSLDTSNVSSVVFKPGSNITISKDASGNITLASHNTTNSSVATSLDSDGFITVTVTDSDNNAKSGKTSTAIKYNVGGTNYVPGQTLPVYTKTEIDNKLKGLNGMTYKGTVGTGGTVTALPTTNVASGDTYLVVGDSPITYADGKTAKKGDLLIATGTETDGVLTTIVWTYVPSGDDEERDTTYKFKVDPTNNSITLVDTGETAVTGKHTIAVENNGALEISSAAADSNKSLTTTLKHKKIAAITPTTDTVNDAKSFTVIGGVTVDAYGHITGYQNKTVNVLQYTATGNASVASNKVTYATKLVDSNSTTVSTVNHTLKSTSLTITADGANGAAIEMNWGSF